MILTQNKVILITTVFFLKPLINQEVDQSISIRNIDHIAAIIGQFQIIYENLQIIL